MSKPDINPMDLKQELMEALTEINDLGVNDDQLTIEPIGLIAEPFDIDNPMKFVEGESTFARAGVAFINSRPDAIDPRGAGLSTLQFVILLSVSAHSSGASTYANAEAVKANNLLYAMQRFMQGRVSQTGYNWMWAGHGLLPDAEDLNDGLLVYQQVWEVKHGYKGHSNN